ncbi:probable 3-hydroxyacyl-CoA dehydrogenase B0272.3 [Tetranychus urticae]|uniref:probable 3-hydroxyacyl-CoA dehydrogenase B0272.3 n=1 Tax=Tetranychus urticae TaxID=32264 RepID=UPI00077BC71A|nr:probable 3-hydroxyacyl-CoA dehydrogenase B0272.3 [Tetranychus urticae]
MFKRILSTSYTLRNQSCLYFGRSISTSKQLDAMKVENMLIIGSGLMGSGIAQASAQSGPHFNSIVIQDVNQGALDKAAARIKSNLEKMKSKNSSINVDEIMGRITFSTNIQPKSTDNLLVIEAITEVLDVKQNLFKNLSEQFKDCPNVILATNTSSLPCKDIGIHVTNHSRYAGLHFFNPVPLMKLVEVVKLDNTSDDTYDSLVDYVKSIGKVSVKCKDTPGFIVNRLLLPYMSEAIQMLERGDATVRDIDTAMKLGAGYPMGPFELMDYVGLDTVQLINEAWMKRDPDLIKPSKILKEMVDSGRFGKKSGKGFYEYK